MQTAANPPNKLLLVEGLPASATADMLELVFKQYLGLVEVRLPISPALAMSSCSAGKASDPAARPLRLRQRL